MITRQEQNEAEGLPTLTALELQIIEELQDEPAQHGRALINSMGTPWNKTWLKLTRLTNLGYIYQSTSGLRATKWAPGD